MAKLRGRFLTLEGGEGAGKSTQGRRLKRRLEAMGLEVMLTREPGGSPRAERIREVLLGGEPKAYGPFAEGLLFAAARADHVDQTIGPALGRGAFVVCDRFTDSTRVYQGVLGEVSERVLASLERVALGVVTPDLTLVLDVPAKLGLARATERRQASGQAADRFETEGVAFHSRIREAFLAIAAAEPNRCAVVDASGPPDNVERLIWAEVEQRLLTLAMPEPGRVCHDV